MADPKQHPVAVPRKQLNVYLSRALGHWQTGHEAKADDAARMMVNKLRAVGILSEKPA